MEFEEMKQIENFKKIAITQHFQDQIEG